VVTLDDIAANDYNLNISRYVAPRDDREIVTVDKAMKRLEETAQTAFAAEEKLIAILKREGFLA
jgi:type I restriction enzyme M protein